MIENDIQFEELSKEIISLTKNIKDMENHILDNANTLTDYLKTSEELYRKLELVYTYANMICDTDSLNNDYQKLKLKAEKLYDEVNEKLSFVKTEILSNNLEYINTLLQTSNYLSDYKLSFEKLFRYQKYTLSDKEEALLSKVCNALNSGSEAFYNLNNADIKLGLIKDETGKKVELTASNYIKYVSSKNRRVRKNAFKVLYQFYYNHKNTITALLKSKIKENNILCDIRGFNSPLEQSLYQDNIKLDVYTSLIKTVKDNLDTMYDYMEERKKAIQLPGGSNPVFDRRQVQTINPLAPN